MTQSTFSFGRISHDDTMAYKINIEEVNDLEDEQFETIFQNVIELCPDAAKVVKRRKPFDSLQNVWTGFCKYLDDLPQEGKLTVLKLHPDLAGKLAKSGGLTKESTEEQQGAGLDKLTAEQRRTIDAYNEKYKKKFGFPFLICARENKLQSIMEGLENRYSNMREKEIVNGIEEVKKICRLRLKDIILDD